MNALSNYCCCCLGFCNRPSTYWRCPAGNRTHCLRQDIVNSRSYSSRGPGSCCSACQQVSVNSARVTGVLTCIIVGPKPVVLASAEDFSMQPAPVLSFRVISYIRSHSVWMLDIFLASTGHQCILVPVTGLLLQHVGATTTLQELYTTVVTL